MQLETVGPAATAAPSLHSLETDDADDRKLSSTSPPVDEPVPSPPIWQELHHSVSAVASLDHLNDENDDDEKAKHQLMCAIAAQAEAIDNALERQLEHSYNEYQYSFKQRATHPGAVAIGGQDEANLSSQFDPTASGTSAPHTVVAEIVNFTNDEEVLKRAHLEFLRGAVMADVVPPKKFRNRLLPCFVVMAVLLVTIATFLSVILTRAAKQRTNSPPQKLANGSSTQVPSFNPQISKGHSDFTSSDPNLTILEMLDGARNHTLLANYFNRNGSSVIQDYLATQVTLFAPTDESFRLLSDPYSFYADAAWEGHLELLLAYHIVTEPLNRMLIFSADALPTVIMPLSNYDQLTTDTQGPYLPVNQSDMTIDNGAHLAPEDVSASNGYILVPDRVLLYDQLRLTLFDYTFSGTTTSITNFQGLLQLTERQSVLVQNFSQGFTILIPTDAAFASLDAFTQQALFDSNSVLANDLVSYNMVHFNLYPSVIRDARELAITTSSGVSAWVTTDGNNEFLINNALIQGFVFVRNGYVAHHTWLLSDERPTLTFTFLA